MSSQIPSVADLKQAVESGQRITPQDVSAISQAESDLTGRGPIRGGPAGKSKAKFQANTGDEDNVNSLRTLKPLPRAWRCDR